MCVCVYSKVQGICAVQLNLVYTLTKMNLVSICHQGQTTQVLTISVVFSTVHEVGREQEVVTIQMNVLSQTLTNQV